MLKYSVLLLFLGTLLYACRSTEPVVDQPVDKQFEKQLTYHNRSLKLDPNHGPTYRARGNLYYTKGMYAEALADYSRALANQDSSFQTLYQRGMTHMELANDSAARVDFERAYLRNQQHAPTLSFVGYYRLLDEQYQEAANLLNQALALDSTLLPCYGNRGSALYHLGETKRAIEDFRYVLAREPNNAIAMSNLGLALCDLNQWDEGIMHLDQALALDPALAEAWYNRGLARYTRGDIAGANEDFAEAKTLNPSLVIMIDGIPWETRN